MIQLFFAILFSITFYSCRALDNDERSLCYAVYKGDVEKINRYVCDETKEWNNDTIQILQQMNNALIKNTDTARCTNWCLPHPVTAVAWTSVAALFIYAALQPTVYTAPSDDTADPLTTAMTLVNYVGGSVFGPLSLWYGYCVRGVGKRCSSLEKQNNHRIIKEILEKYAQDHDNHHIDC